MIASVILQNLVYLIGAVVAAVVLGLGYTLYHRRPKSVESNMESFNRGLRALAPDATPRRRRWSRQAPAPVRAPAPGRNVHTVVPALPGESPVRPSVAGGRTSTTEAETG